jgi:23S rRNA (pseudouridine1915-N3)-methyltransferase
MRFRLLAVGRVNRSLGPACDDYMGRIKRYFRFEMLEVAESRSTKDPVEMRRKEGAAILKALDPAERLILVTRTGAPLTSRGLAGRIGRWQEDARDMVFAIGGSEGFDQTVVERSEYSMSLSPFTLPHDLARLVILEQIYRACTILRGEPYHRGD